MKLPSVDIKIFKILPVEDIMKTFHIHITV